MNEEKNLQVVRDAYAAFGRRDIPALLNLLTEDIDWQTFGPTELPQAGRRMGRPDVGQFFAEVDETWNFERFEPRQFIAQGDAVIALGYCSGTAKGTGRKFEAEFAHAFTIGNGKIAKFREYTDTAALIKAVAAAPARV